MNKYIQRKVKPIFCGCQFYRCFVAFVKCQTDPQSSHIFNTQQSSRAEDHLPTNGLHLHAAKPEALPDRQAFGPGAPAASQIQQEHRTLILVVHYTPWDPGWLEAPHCMFSRVAAWHWITASEDIRKILAFTTWPLRTHPRPDWCLCSSSPTWITFLHAHTLY